MITMDNGNLYHWWYDVDFSAQTISGRSIPATINSRHQPNAVSNRLLSGSLSRSRWPDNSLPWPTQWPVASVHVPETLMSIWLACDEIIDTWQGTVIAQMPLTNKWQDNTANWPITDKAVFIDQSFSRISIAGDVGRWLQGCCIHFEIK